MNKKEFIEIVRNYRILSRQTNDLSERVLTLEVKLQMYIFVIYIMLITMFVYLIFEYCI